jgi:cytoskeleton protein RodZ
MSESGQASVGHTLRAAREVQGITLEDAAIRLRLMQRQIEAMEADDFASLGQPVFARGFVRNYARLLGLAPEALLSRMEGAPAEPAAVSHAAPQPPSFWLNSPWLLGLLLGVVLLVTVPVGLYLWLNSDAEEAPISAAPARPAAVKAPARLAPMPPAPPPVVVPPAVPAVVPPVPEQPATLPAPAGSGVPAAPTSPAPPTPVEAPAAARGALHLEFGVESWSEIKDASGRVLLRKLNPAGSSVDLKGQPPFELVIGGAAQVQLTYNGRPIDMKPFIDVAVARFTLEE